ncbi:MAG: InlB B-repeat-containing protein, partial [Clostridia bacterium]|nr:InlB B-repeat-containing protein [Clostridia bacterium]
MKKSNQSKSSFNWKKKLCCTLLVCALALTCGAAVSCNPKNNNSGNSSSGDVVENVTLDVGEYYYDAEGVEHLLTINAEEQYVYTAGEVRYEGAYTVSGNTVTFANSPMTAEVENGVIVLTVNDTAMRLWKKVNYTVDFTSNGVSLQTASVLNGKKVEKPADPTLEGYQFIGWYTDAAFEKAFRFDSNIVTSNVTLYARWVETDENGYEYKVSFDLNYEGAGEAPADVETIDGKVYEPNLPAEPTREGYEFKGW